jgi:hypothetical protein
MKRRTVVLVVGLAATLTLPGRAYAIDHIALFVSPTSIAPAPAKEAKRDKQRPNPLASWRLSAAVVAATSPGGKEIFGVSLRRSFMSGRAEELHAFRAVPARTVTFDGRTGRWQARFGSHLTVTMTITTTGAMQPIGESQGCRGALVQVPVQLRGSFVLRTGTKFFKTIRRARLSGTVTFNPSGPVDCTPPSADSCTPSSSLGATKLASGSLGVTVLMSPDSGGWMSLSFADRRASAFDGATWYHVMFVRGINPLSGQLPIIDARLPPTLPLQGDGTFTAQQTSMETRGACRTVSAIGTFSGTFRTRFAGWGARAVNLNPADYAGYSEDR